MVTNNEEEVLQQASFKEEEYILYKVLIDIRNWSVFAGGLSPRAMGLVVEWATLHQQELMADWETARTLAYLEGGLYAFTGTAGAICPRWVCAGFGIDSERDDCQRRSCDVVCA
ncbi:MAG TPA: DUF4160 domain-containing protein [Candidatus Handelsmanbacteria bacterium]|nr:DUF4160 domain-containing protein [Candidatus Handelsmanbacteria bacterium]HIK98794.1 DUF4160 domain-containing protein [Dehalococcoidia bacterium]